MKLTDKVAIAEKFASMMHADKGMTYDHKPYSYHLKRVVHWLLRFGVIDRDILAAGWLHDILEDTGVSANMLVEMFGLKTARLVWAVTDEPGANRKERKALTYPKIRGMNDATQLKLADRLANVENSIDTRNERMFLMYLKEHREFSSELFQMKNLTTELRDMWQEYVNMMDKGLEKIRSAGDVHTSHCCKEHLICKYGNVDGTCSVVEGRLPPEYPCNCFW